MPAVAAALLFFAVIASAALRPDVAAAGEPPVAAYSFDAGEGTVAEDVVGEHDGTLEGATWFDKGRFGKALLFDGEETCVTIPHAADLELGEEMTLQAWVKPHYLSDQPILYKSAWGNLGYAMGIDFFNAAKPEGLIGEGPGKYEDVVAPEAVEENVWTHIAFSYDGAKMRLFVNGEHVATQVQSTPPPGGEGPLAIGCNPLYPEDFDGLIDEVRIYDRALDAGEIQGTMSSGFPIATTEPATDVGANAAILNGTANANSGETEYFFEYGPTKSYGNVIEGEEIGGRETVEVNEAAIDLEPETNYHYRLVAKGPAGIAFGKDQTMTTLKREISAEEEKEIREAEAAMELTPSEKKAGPGDFYGMMWSGDLHEMRTMKVKEQNIYKAMERSGAKMFHFGMGPNAREVEEAEGVKEPKTPLPTPDEADEAFKIADKAGITVLPGLGGGPFPRPGTVARKAWLIYAKKAVEKYGPESSLSHPAETWVIWNEPNMPQFGGYAKLTPEQQKQREAIEQPGVNPAEFAVFFKEMAEALRSGSKKPIKILTPGLYGFRSIDCSKQKKAELKCPMKPTQFLKKMDAQLGGSGTYDGIALHPYVFKILGKYTVAINHPTNKPGAASNQRAPVNAGEVKQLSKAIKRSISGVHNAYSSKPLWITELGFPLGNKRNPRQVPWVSPEIQKLLVKASFSMIQNNRKQLNIEHAFYYNIQDNPGPDREGWEYRSGLLGEYGGVRPAWKAYSDLAGGLACPFAPC